MSIEKQNALIAAFREDLKAMANDTYIAPRPHPVFGCIDDIDEKIDARQTLAQAA